eukprot:jgi/Botrbrau1/13015/Bobra.0389s0012.1
MHACREQAWEAHARSLHCEFALRSKRSDKDSAVCVGLFAITSAFRKCCQIHMEKYCRLLSPQTNAKPCFTLFLHLRILQEIQQHQLKVCSRSI